MAIASSPCSCKVRNRRYDRPATAAYAGGMPDERQRKSGRKSAGPASPDGPHRDPRAAAAAGAGFHRADAVAAGIAQPSRPVATVTTPQATRNVRSRLPRSRSPTCRRRAQAMPLASGFDVQQFEAMAQALVADQRVPGLAMAIVQNGRILSARGYGITDVSDAAAGRRAHRVPAGIAVQGVRRHHDRPAGVRRRAALGQPASPTTCPRFSFRSPARRSS